MAELVAHEVQVSFAAQCVSDEPNHFMQGNATVNHWTVVGFLGHVCVDFTVKQPHRDRFVTYNTLVVAFAISHGEQTISKKENPIIVMQMPKKVGDNFKERKLRLQFCFRITKVLELI